MKKIFIVTIVILAGSIEVYAQSKKGEKRNAIGISIPVIYNHSNGIYYGSGNRREPTGKAISYGINAHLSRAVYKNIFIALGAGYFKQNFAINRPFEFDGDTVTNLLYSTKKYSYHNIYWEIGIGYDYKLNENLALKVCATYNSFNSFKQYYLPWGLSGYQHKDYQENTKSLKAGWGIFLSGGIERRINKKFGLGTEIATPVLLKWNNDEVFIYSYWGNDAQKIAENRFSAGLVFSCKYYF